MEVDPKRNYASYFFYLLSTGKYTAHESVTEVIRLFLSEKDGNTWRLWNAFLKVEEKFIFQNLLTKIYRVDGEKIDSFMAAWDAGMKGNSEIAFIIGHTFRNRDDMRNAFVWYSKSSNYGNKRATMEVAMCHIKGLGTPKDSHKASMLYYMLGYPPEGGPEPCPVAIHNLAVLSYREGNRDKSVEHLNVACTMNYAPSWREVGKLHMEREMKENAIICLKKAIELGDLTAGFILASYPGVPPDIRYLRKLAEKGCAPAAVSYGFQILTGRVNLSWRESRKYFFIGYGRSERGRTLEQYCVHVLRYLEFFGNGVDPRPDGIREDYMFWDKDPSPKRLKIALSEPIEYARWYRDEGDMIKSFEQFQIVIHQKDITSPDIVKEAYVNLGYMFLLRLIGPEQLFNAHEMFGKAAQLEKNPIHKKGFVEAIIFVRKELEKDPKNTKIIHDLWLAEGHSQMAKKVLERAPKKVPLEFSM